MSGTTQNPIDLTDRIPEPSNVKGWLRRNRRERLLLHQLLKLAERVHVDAGRLGEVRDDSRAGA